MNHDSEAKKTQTAIPVSVITPVYNEQQNLAEFIPRLTAVMDKAPEDWEIIFVDDGSSDNSLKMLSEAAASRPEIKIISLSRNFGHQTAISAGMKYAAGQNVVLLDGDLQDHPEAIPELLGRISEGYDVVYAVRFGRKEGPLLRLCFFLFYRLLNLVSPIRIPVDVGDFCVMNRKVVDLLNRMPERNRFVRFLRSWVGFRQTGVRIERAGRENGRSKFSLASRFKLALDALLSAPNFLFPLLTLVGFVGAIAATAGFALGAIFASAQVAVGLGSIYLIAAVASFLASIGFLVLFLVGEYLKRILDQSRERPAFIVDQLVNFSDDKK